MTTDLNTAEGITEWMKELPTENIRNIANRTVDQFNILLVTAASMELIVRGES